MKKDEAESIVRSLEGFNRLERKNTDEVGWIALRYSCTRAKAERMIETARSLVPTVAPPETGINPGLDDLTRNLAQSLEASQEAFALHADTGQEDSLSPEAQERHVEKMAGELREERLLREAAPKMLAALKELLSWRSVLSPLINSLPDRGEAIRATFEEVRAVIAAAEGK